jgi:hypothetical protein
MAIRRRGRQQQWTATAAILLVLCLAGGAIYIFWPPPPVYLDEHNCPTNQPLEKHTIILVDATDPFNGDQLRSLRAVFKRETDGADPYEKFTVLEISENDPFGPTQRVTICAPEESEATRGMTLMGRLSKNPSWVDAAWKQFLKAVDVTDTIAKAKAQNSTPLIESIFELGQRDDFSPNVSGRRLVIVSDLLQNTDAFYSLYKSPPVFQDFKQSPGAAKLIPNLRGIAVVAYYVVRPSSQHALEAQGACQLQFWKDYFAAAHAKSFDVKEWPWSDTPPANGACEHILDGGSSHAKKHLRSKRRLLHRGIRISQEHHRA